MGKLNKKKLYKYSKKFVNASNMKMLILMIPLTVLLIRGISSGEYSLSSFLDVSILISFLLLFICDALAYVITYVINAKCEDAVKLTEDYSNLTKKYCSENLVKYKGEIFPEICIAFRREEEKPFTLELKMDVEHPIYQLPKQVSDHSAELMGAHKYSTVYNNINVRINDCRQNGSTVEILYGRTTYYDSLITNRAMDFPIGGKSIREIYEPGPFLSTLSESKMSNHLGFNGFVELEDGKIIFIHRNTDVSIGKNTLANSIGASYKAMYGLDKNRHMTEETISNAIRMEIRDELKIDVPHSISLAESIFSFYRDIVEGGKPQFLFYIKLPDLTVERFEDDFQKQTKGNGQKKNEHKKVVTDGYRFEYFNLEQLNQFTFHPSEMVTTNGTKYRMMPSAVVSVLLLLKYKGKIE